MEQAKKEQLIKGSFIVSHKIDSKRSAGLQNYPILGYAKYEKIDKTRKSRSEKG